jgi:hypothetical protein
MKSEEKTKARLKSKKLLMIDLTVEITFLAFKASTAPIWERPIYIHKIFYLKQKLAAVRNTDEKLFCLNSKKIDMRRLRKKNRKADYSQSEIIIGPK